MNRIERLLKERGIPPLLVSNNGASVSNTTDFEARREELKTLLAEKLFGKIPPLPEKMDVRVISENEHGFAGKATVRELSFDITLGESSFSFPVSSVIPNGVTNIPAFVNIGFWQQLPNKYAPIEEIIDNGFAFFYFDYRNVSSDDNNFSDKCAPYLCPDRELPSATGKISMWAWSAMRVMDYIETLDCIDKDNVAVVGHSRLGKTALWTGGCDERFKYIISNDSGCCGAAISRGKVGEQPNGIAEVFPQWFCPDYIKNSSDPDNLPFDQHYLIALSVPRHIIVTSAEEDVWADPASEFLGLAAVNEAYALFGLSGLIHDDVIPEPTALLDKGESCYFLRKGYHYMTRQDWAVFMNFIKKHIGRE